MGVGMLGYAIAKQKVTGVRHPLQTRAFYIGHPESGTQVVYCVAELCFITQAIRHGVLEKLALDYPKLGLNEHNVMLTATHTHSGPAGFSHFLLYNMTAPGFVHSVYQAIVDAMVAAIVEACASNAPGKLYRASAEMPAGHKVAFNRSLKAYNQNPEIDPLPTEGRNEAVNRKMTVLRFESENGTPLGILSFFAVHCTSYHSDNGLIDSDNKGIAARKFEKMAARKLGLDQFVAGFAQSTAGDVSPNFLWDPKRGVMGGEFESDENSAIYNGTLQFEFANTLFNASRREPMAVKPVLALTHYEDHGRVKVMPEFSEGHAGQSTSPGQLGLSMIMGTAEGRGPLFAARSTVETVNHLTGVGKRWLRKLRDPNENHAQHAYHRYGPSFQFLDLSRGVDGRCFYIFKQGRPILPNFVDPGIARVRHLNKSNAVGDAPWTPQVLPVQLMVIGDFALAGIPGEPTTVAGMRLAQSLTPRLENLGVKEILVAGFANGYSGYVTTHQEYQVQAYEGGSTHFGPWTLAGYQTRFDQLGRKLCELTPSMNQDLGETPYIAKPEELYFRRFELA